MEETVKKLSGECWEGRLLHKLFQLIVLNATNVVVGILLAAQLLAVDDAMPLRAWWHLGCCQGNADSAEQADLPAQNAVGADQVVC